MKNSLIFALLIFTSLCQTAGAEPLAPVSVSLSLTHTGADKWRADYVFGEAVDGLRLGPALAGYRKQAWRVLTPGLALVETDGQEAIRGSGKPVTALSVEVTLFLPYAMNNYTPFDRFSDGGTDVYTGFFDGEAMQGEHARPLRLSLHLTGLADEHVITPVLSAPGDAGYAYFGPRKPATAGAATLILDPRTPDWMAAMLLETTATISTFYEKAFQRKLGYQPLLLLSIGNLEQPGLSVKGGAIGKQVVYRLEGKALMGGSPTVRQYCMELIAHELAHVWQSNVARGGIGEKEAWIHEGGAEAIAVAALRQSGLFGKDEAALYASKLIDECAALKGSVDSYRGVYACGFKRFADYDQDIFALWKAMMETSETSGEVYSTAMIDAVRQRPGKLPAAPH